MTAKADPYWGGLAKYSAYFVSGSAMALMFLPTSAFSGEALRLEPVTAAAYGEMMVLDGNRADEAVLFAHQDHVDREGGDESCASCHHMVKAGGQASSCAECHSDMWVETSIFDHDLHAARLETGEGCSACHMNAEDPKDIEHAKPCLECHTEMAVPGATIELKNPPHLGLAVGYVNAFHSVCVDCHEERAADPELDMPDLGKCASCHTGTVPALDPMKPDTRVPPGSSGNGTER